eukprot:m.274631 g.274631  ORF g.274631 m.274631 type:complete len:103 (-) comp15687_c0_seq4:251-559(-)
MSWFQSILMGDDFENDTQDTATATPEQRQQPQAQSQDQGTAATAPDDKEALKSEFEKDLQGIKTGFFSFMDQAKHFLDAANDRVVGTVGVCHSQSHICALLI